MSETLPLNLTKEQALGITYLNLKYVLGIDFPTFHKIAEFALGKPIYIHQLGTITKDSVVQEIFVKWDAMIAAQKAKTRQP